MSGAYDLRRDLGTADLPDEYVALYLSLRSAFRANIGAPTLLLGEYRNPFDFMTEFDQWWEFGVRQVYYKEETSAIIRDMLQNDLHRASLSFDLYLTILKSIHRGALLRPRQFELDFTKGAIPYGYTKGPVE